MNRSSLSDHSNSSQKTPNKNQSVPTPLSGRYSNSKPIRQDIAKQRNEVLEMESLQSQVQELQKSKAQQEVEYRLSLDEKQSEIEMLNEEILSLKSSLTVYTSKVSRTRSLSGSPVRDMSHHHTLNESNASIEECHSTIEEQQKYINELLQLMSEAELHISELQSKLSQSVTTDQFDEYKMAEEKEKSRLKEEVNSWQSSHRSLMIEFGQLTHTNQRLQEQLQEAGDERDQCKRELSQLKQFTSSLISQHPSAAVTQNESNHATTTTDIVPSEQESDLNSSFSLPVSEETMYSTTDVSELRSLLKQSQKNVNSLRERVLRQKVEIGRLNEIQVEQSMQLWNVESQLELTISEKQGVERQLTQVQQVVNEMEGQQVELRGAATHYRQTASDVTRERDDLQKKVQKFEIANNQLKETEVQLQQQIQSLMNEKLNHEQLLLNMSSSYTELEMVLSQERSQMKSMTSKLEKEIQMLKKQCNDLKEDKDKAENEQKRIEQEKKEIVSELRESIDCLETSFTMSCGQMQEKDGLIKQLEHEKNELEHRVQSMSEFFEDEHSYHPFNKYSNNTAKRRKPLNNMSSSRSVLNNNPQHSQIQQSATISLLTQPQESTLPWNSTNNNNGESSTAISVGNNGNATNQSDLLMSDQWEWFMTNASAHFGRLSETQSFMEELILWVDLELTEAKARAQEVDVWRAEGLKTSLLSLEFAGLEKQLKSKTEECEHEHDARLHAEEQLKFMSTTGHSQHLTQQQQHKQELTHHHQPLPIPVSSSIDLQSMESQRIDAHRVDSHRVDAHRVDTRRSESPRPSNSRFVDELESLNSSNQPFEGFIHSYGPTAIHMQSTIIDSVPLLDTSAVSTMTAKERRQYALHVLSLKEDDSLASKQFLEKRNQPMQQQVQTRMVDDVVKQVKNAANRSDVSESQWFSPMKSSSIVSPANRDSSAEAVRSNVSDMYRAPNAKNSVTRVPISTNDVNRSSLTHPSSSSLNRSNLEGKGPRITTTPPSVSHIPNDVSIISGGLAVNELDSTLNVSFPPNFVHPPSDNMDSSDRVLDKIRSIENTLVEMLSGLSLYEEDSLFLD